MSRSSQWPRLEQGLGSYQPFLPQGLVLSWRKPGQAQLKGIYLFWAVHCSHQTNLQEHLCPEMCLKSITLYFLQFLPTFPTYYRCNFLLSLYVWRSQTLWSSVFTRSVILPGHAGPCRSNGCLPMTSGLTATSSQLWCLLGCCAFGNPRQKTALSSCQAGPGKLVCLVALCAMSDYVCASFA